MKKLHKDNMDVIKRYKKISDPKLSMHLSYIGSQNKFETYNKAMEYEVKQYNENTIKLLTWYINKFDCHNEHIDYHFLQFELPILEIYRQRKFAYSMNPNVNEKLNTCQSLLEEIKHSPVNYYEYIIVGYFFLNAQNKVLNDDGYKKKMYEVIKKSSEIDLNLETLYDMINMSINEVLDHISSKY